MLNKLKKAISYNPDTGIFTRLSTHAGKAYMHPNATGAPRVSVLGKEYSARCLAWFLMTGYYPKQFELKSLDGDIANVKWSNIYKTKDGHKFCSKCKLEKPFSAFGKNRSRTAGHDPACKECKKPAARRYAHKTNMKAFGLTPETYETILTQQGYVCAICKNIDKNKRLAVDHCHNTNRIRGLLCAKCNQALGLFNDSPTLLNRAINYLDEPTLLD